MNYNEGNLKEAEVIDALNDKAVSSLDNNMKTMLRNLFGVLDESIILKCYKVDDANKTDFVIEYGSRKKNISMKSGRAEIVHNEILANFISFLSSLGITDETLETIMLFHYGDGTTDGTGEVRKPYRDVVNELGSRIAEANAELNCNLDVVLKVVERCVFKGSDPGNIEADAIYFGNKYYGTIATKNQIYKHVRRRSFDYYDNLHIGPLLIRPDARYVDRDITYERKRNRIVAYWPNLSADVEYIANRYDYDYR